MSEVKTASDIIIESKGVMDSLVTAGKKAEYLDEAAIEKLAELFFDLQYRDTLMKLFVDLDHDGRINALKAISRAGIDLKNQEINADFTAVLAAFTVLFAAKNEQEGVGILAIETFIAEGLVEQAKEEGSELPLLSLISRMYSFGVPISVFLQSVEQLSLEEMAEGV